MLKMTAAISDNSVQPILTISLSFSLLFSLYSLSTFFSSGWYLTQKFFLWNYENIFVFFQYSNFLSFSFSLFIFLFLVLRIWKFKFIYFHIFDVTLQWLLFHTFCNESAWTLLTAAMVLLFYCVTLGQQVFYTLFFIYPWKKVKKSQIWRARWPRGRTFCSDPNIWYILIQQLPHFQTVMSSCIVLLKNGVWE